MKRIYPEYASNLGFVGVAINPTEGIDKIVDYSDKEGFTWPMAIYDANILKEFRIIERSTKIGIGGDGIIKFRKGFGLNSEEIWKNILESLSRS